MSTSRRDRNSQAVADRAARVMKDTRFRRLRTRRVRVLLASSMLALSLRSRRPGSCPVRSPGSPQSSLQVSCGGCSGCRCDSSPTCRRTISTSGRPRSAIAAMSRPTAGSAAPAWSWPAWESVASVASGDHSDTWRIVLRYDTLMGFFWALGAAALSLPSIVLALRDRELPV